jgi:hypothetical protein
VPEVQGRAQTGHRVRDLRKSEAQAASGLDIIGAVGLGHYLSREPQDFAAAYQHILMEVDGKWHVLQA